MMKSYMKYTKCTEYTQKKKEKEISINQWQNYDKLLKLNYASNFTLVKGLLCRWPSITEWEVHITAQGPRLQNDLYCVELDVKLYYTIPISSWHTHIGWQM